MKTPQFRRRALSFKPTVAGAAAAVLLLSACGGSGGATETEAERTDSGGAITVWVDPPRVPAAEAFVKAHPEIETEVVQIDGTVGGKTLQQQFSQFSQAGEGFPDAIFFPSNDDIAWATGAQINYAADLSEVMPDVIEGYDEAVISPCAIDDAIRCLRNDAAPDVFWYNKTFFDANGYTLPTTWEEYGDLAVTIAQEHPGKISAFLGDSYAPDRYLWASGCPTNNRISETEVQINLDDERCERAKSLISTLVEGDAATSLGIFDADAAGIGADLVMSPGAAWWGDYLFNQTWAIEAGTMSAVAPLSWEGETEPSTGNEGGGLWGLSNFIEGKQLENAKTFMEFVATDPAWQVELSTGLPGYGPVQDDWIEKQSASQYFADTETTFQAIKEATPHVVEGHAYMLYNTGGVWAETMTPALVSGNDVEAGWSAFEERLLNEAKAQGYTVVTDAPQ